MKKIILPIIIAILIFLEIKFMPEIQEFVSNIINTHPQVKLQPKNEYTKDDQFLFIQETENFEPYSKHDLLNIFYSIINNGWLDFTFYCPKEYESCLKDIQEISNDDALLTSVNNYAHPFNSFLSLNTTYDDSGEVTINVKRLYSDEMIKKINDRVDQLLLTLINDKQTTKDKIKTIHDYIINNSKYDVIRNNEGNSNYSSHTAYGPLFQGQAICSGYSDLMEIFLTKLNIPNYKIASGTHVWNAVKLDNKWLHLDLTWDDPVASTGEDILDHKYFLIDNNELNKVDGKYNEHNFDKTVYLEFK